MTAYAEPMSQNAPAATSQSWGRAAVFMLMAIAALAGHFLLGAEFGPIGFLWITLIIGASFFVSWELAFAILMGVLFLQNTFIGAMMPEIQDPSRFDLLLGSGFGLTGLVAVIYGPAWLRVRRALPKENNILLRSLIVFLIVVTAYTALGSAYVSPTSTLVYARVYFTGGLMLIIGCALGLRLGFDFVLSIVRILALILIVWAGVEYFCTYSLYDALNYVAFFNYKLSSLDYASTFASASEIIDDQTNSYLNLSGQFGLNIELLRLMGPNLHSISYAYALAFASLVNFIGRRYVLTGLGFLLILLIGAKGPLLMTMLSLGLGVFYMRTRNRKAVLTSLIVLLVLFVVVGLAYGIQSEDYHVVGFFGGLRGFIGNPLGHGIGVGGNMSSLGMREANFSLFQGYGADFALESAMGVMLYQIGIGAVAFFIFYWFLWKNVWNATRHFDSEPRLIVVPIALAFLVANSIFQEEVFSPTGWGLWLLFSGLLLMRRWKEDHIQLAPQI